MSNAMTLNQALFILAQSHTSDDELAGFVVHQRDRFRPYSDEDYIAAWRMVRIYLRMPVLSARAEENANEYERALLGI